MSESNKFQSWAVVEVMGHSRYAGYVTEQAIGGASLIRVDVPAVKGAPAFTKLLGASSIFAITPCTEEVAKRAAEMFCNRPLTYLALPEPPGERFTATDFEDEEDEEDEQEDLSYGG